MSIRVGTEETLNFAQTLKEQHKTDVLDCYHNDIIPLIKDIEKSKKCFQSNKTISMCDSPRQYDVFSNVNNINDWITGMVKEKHTLINILMRVLDVYNKFSLFIKIDDDKISTGNDMKAIIGSVVHKTAGQKKQIISGFLDAIEKVFGLFFSTFVTKETEKIHYENESFILLNNQIEQGRRAIYGIDLIYKMTDISIKEFFMLVHTNREQLFKDKHQYN